MNPSIPEALFFAHQFSHADFYGPGLRGNLFTKQPWVIEIDRADAFP